jgi:glutamate--cysteine ligase catalytic subunit
VSFFYLLIFSPSLSLSYIIIIIIVYCRRATGQLLTPATWMRQFVEHHPDYQHDSIITQSIAYDLMKTCHGIGIGEIPCPELLGDVRIDR